MSLPDARNALRHRVRGNDSDQGSDEPDQPNYARCIICLEDKPTDKGLACPNGHFLCDECLGDYFTSRVNIGTIQTDLLKLPCPEPDCGLPSFAPLRLIAMHLPPIAIGLILNNLEAILEILTRERGQQQNPPDNVQQRPPPDPHDDIQPARRYVIDDILTIKTPCCRRAFIDFDGCSALFCVICPHHRRAFCAMCLAPCGSNAHAHVREQHEGRLFISEQEFREHHNRRRQGLLLEYVRGLDAIVDREALLNALRQDLADLGMNVDDIRALLRVNPLPAIAPAHLPAPPVAQQLPPVAPPMLPFMQRRRRNCRKGILIVVLFLIVLALSITLGVTLSTSRKAPSTPTTLPSTTTASAAIGTPSPTKPPPTSFGPLTSDTLVAFPSPLPPPASPFRRWGPEQAIGSPNTFSYGDLPTAWATRQSDGPPEWLLLDYDVPVNPARVDVYETYNPGAVVAVWVFPPGLSTSAMSGAELFWSGVDPTNITTTSKPFHVFKDGPAIDMQFVTSRLLIVIDNSIPGWNEIDAVGLIDQDQQVQWAVSAAASSSYAGGNYFPTSSTPSSAPSSATASSHKKPNVAFLSILVAILLFPCYCACCP